MCLKSSKASLTTSKNKSSIFFKIVIKTMSKNKEHHHLTQGVLNKLKQICKHSHVLNKCKDWISMFLINSVKGTKWLIFWQNKASKEVLSSMMIFNRCQNF